MKRIIFLIFLLTFLFGFSNALLVSNNYSNLVDACCIIDLINYKEKLKEYQKILHTKYPELEKQVDNYVYKVQKAIRKSPKFRKNKLKLYKEIIRRMQDYVYTHNVMPPKPSYYMIAYFTYRIKDIYEYEKNKQKYNLEAMLENLDKAYGY